MKLEELKEGGAGRYFILCNRCGEQLEDEFCVFRLALLGPQGLGDDDAVLLCVPWRERASRVWFSSQPYACDGCSQLVAVAPSSRWFIERHKAERE